MSIVYVLHVCQKMCTTFLLLIASYIVIQMFVFKVPFTAKLYFDILQFTQILKITHASPTEIRNYISTT